MFAPSTEHATSVNCELAVTDQPNALTDYPPTVTHAESLGEKPPSDAGANRAYDVFDRSVRSVEIVNRAA